MKSYRLLEDSRFWQAATVAVPVSMAVAMFIFVAFAGVADLVDSSSGASSGVLFGIPVGALIVAACLLAFRRTPRCSGAALGMAAAGLLVGYVGLMAG